MDILITGATGFIGSRLCRLLGADNENSLFSLQRPGHLPVEGITAIEWDLSCRIDENILPDAIDAVVHLALARDIRRFPEAVPELFAVNVRTTIELLEYARKAGASHFFMASTGNSYAPDLGLCIGEQPVPPNDFYTSAKLAAEALVRPYRSCFPVNILRAFFPYGPGQGAKTIQRLIARVKTSQPISLAKGLNGDGDQLSLIYVDDLVQAIAQSISEGWDGLFDVATPEVLSVRQIVMEIGQQLGIEPVFEYGDTPAKKMSADLRELNERSRLSFRSFSDGLSELLAEETELLTSD
ncbi:MAG: NAD(P)-dependent oxidoreductase [Rhodospirillaceae bacterium]|nr:NAD(P)-dependent oxidoreductase [Rhodospirillaceae bacterium]